LAELNAKLAEADAKYQKDLSKIPEDWLEQERINRMQSLKNGHATKKSQIRRSFGVTLRPSTKRKSADTPGGDILVGGNSGMQMGGNGGRFQEYRAPPPNMMGPGPGEDMRSNTGRTNKHVSSAYDPANGPSGYAASNSNSGFTPLNRPPMLTPKSKPIPNISSSSGHLAIAHILSIGGQSQAQKPETNSLSNPIDSLIKHISYRQSQYQSQHVDKRRRVSDDENPPVAKKVPVGDAQAKWEALQLKDQTHAQILAEDQAPNRPVALISTFGKDKDIATSTLNRRKKASITIISSDESSQEQDGSTDGEVTAGELIPLQQPRTPTQGIARPSLAESPSTISVAESGFNNQRQTTEGGVIRGLGFAKRGKPAATGRG